MIDAVKTLRDVGIQHILGLFVDRDKDRTDGIVGGASGTEAVAVGFEFGFPFRFQRRVAPELGGLGHGALECLRALLVRAALRDPHPPEGLAIRQAIQVLSAKVSRWWG